MAFEPWRPKGFPTGSPKTDAETTPADEDLSRTLGEIEKTSTPRPPMDATPIAPSARGPAFVRTLPPLLFLATAVAVGAAVLTMNFVGHLSRGTPLGPRSAIDSSMQREAEQLLRRLAAGESGAADEVLARSAGWTGKTQRSANTTASITSALNSPDMHAREAAIQAELALDGVAQDESGLRTLEQTVGNPSQRAWALWMLGALGNRGVDAAHATKVIEAYLSDPQADVRASAINGLALVGTDETIPMMLDRFRNDPSPVVQERAACAIAEAGMYTHEQRMTAAASLVLWLDEPQLSVLQRTWALHALRDISGQNFGTDSAAWREWYEGTR